MPWVKPHKEIKAPVFKNMIYAFQILWKVSKTYLIFQIIEVASYCIFVQYFQVVFFLKALLGIIEGSADFGEFVRLLVLFFAGGLVYEITVNVCDYVTLVAQKKVFKNLNNLIFEKAAKVDVSCYEDPAFYDSYQRATEILTGGYFFAFGWCIANMVGGFISFIFIAGTVASIDARYLLFLAPLVLVFVVEYFKSKVVYERDMKMTKNNRIKGYAKRTMFLKDYSKDMRTSNIFGVIIGQFHRAIDDNVHILRSYGVKLFVYSMASTFLGELIPTVGTYAFAAHRFISDSGVQISGFSVVVSSVATIKNVIRGFADDFSELSALALYFQNLREFFDYETSVKSGERAAEEFESLEFKNVSFKYPSADENSLNNVDFKIEKGQTVALVGVNGAGKTTFVKLLLRFYDPTQGEIFYNGRNIKEYDLDSLRARFATVFQDYKTFAVSVNENVICHECSEEEKLFAREALRRSGVLERIDELPEKADTVLTREFDENGAGLSGGENQKTAVARMFARDFDIAILDEPSSALDPIAEYNMYENLIDGTREKTVIYISHRLSSSVLSDKIYVLGGGTVLESGTHDELMKSDGEYCRMFTLQASSYGREEAGIDE